MLSALVRWLLVCACAVVLVTPTLAGSIGVSWNTSANTTGYRVYYGTASGVYSGSIDVGNVTSTTITGLTDCVTWFFAVKGYNFAGESETFSSEVSSLPRPVVTTLSPWQAMQGNQIVIDITGTNFEAGSTVTIDNPNIFLDSPSVLSCTTTQILATVEPMVPGVRAAQIGRFTLTVTSPKSVSGFKTNAFEVLVDPSRFDINQSEDSTRERLDGMDTVWLSRLFGTDETDATFDPDYDFNGDGWVDGDDLSFLASNLGRCWNGSNWSASACPTS